MPLPFVVALLLVLSALIQLLPLKYCNVLVVALYMVKPIEGCCMAFLCIVVSLGGKKPCVVLDISNKADGAGVLVPIPTACAHIIL